MRRLNENNPNTPEHTYKSFIKYGNDIRHLDDHRLLSLAKYFKGGNFLDIGCFHSPLPILMKKKYPGSEITAIDFSSEMIKILKDKYPQVNYLVADACDLPFKDEYFDYIVAGEIIEHLEDPESFIKGVLRILKSGGILALSTPNRETEIGLGSLGGKYHLWSFEEKDFEKWFKEKGERIYKIVKIGDGREKILLWLFKK